MADGNPDQAPDEAHPETNRTDAPALPPDVEEIGRRLIRFVNRICPAWLAGYREDIAQAATVRLLEAWKKSENKPALKSSYLWRVAYTATVDQIREIRRRGATHIDEGPLDDENPAIAVNPQPEHDARDLGRAIQACLLGIHVRRRTVVSFHLVGHDAAEIGQLTGWNTKKVQNLLYRGLDDMRRCLASRGFKR
jgi:RNA polymerase sigma-70 factor (ECF subfamily)